MSYAGDTWTKKLARLNYWLEVIRVLSPARFQRSKFLVLSGPEGGDVRVLRALDVPSQNITACDIDLNAVTAANARGIPVKHTDVLALCRKAPRSFDVMFLDFCSPLSGDLLTYFLRCAAFGCRSPGFVGIGLMYGRETSEAMALVEAARLKIPAMRSLEGSVDALPEAVGDILVGHQKLGALVNCNLGNALNSWGDETFRGDLPEAAMTRLLAFSDSVFQKAAANGIGVQTIHGLTYRSVRRVGTTVVGTPMLYVLSGLYRPAKPLRFETLRQKTLKHFGRLGTKIDDEGNAHVMQMIMDTAQILPDVDGAGVRATALDLASRLGSATAAELFCVPATQVAAWRAVETRQGKK